MSKVLRGCGILGLLVLLVILVINISGLTKPTTPNPNLKKEIDIAVNVTNLEKTKDKNTTNINANYYAEKETKVESSLSKDIKDTQVAYEAKKAEKSEVPVMLSRGSSPNTLALNKSDFDTLCRIVEAEAGDQDILGRELVANVIFNRIKNDEFPKTIREVVFENGQFSPISDGRYWDVNISAETQTAVMNVLKGSDHSQGALYFMQRDIASESGKRYFDTLNFLFKHGAHEFAK